MMEVYAPLKRLSPSMRLHGDISQKDLIFNVSSCIFHFCAENCTNTQPTERQKAVSLLISVTGM
jgi:hypothetical protein